MLCAGERGKDSCQVFVKCFVQTWLNQSNYSNALVNFSNQSKPSVVVLGVKPNQIVDINKKCVRNQTKVFEAEIIREIVLQTWGFHG